MFESNTTIWIILAGLFIYFLARVVPVFIYNWSLRLHTPTIKKLVSLPESIEQLLTPTVLALTELGFDKHELVEIDGVTFELSLGYQLYSQSNGAIASVYCSSIPARNVTAAVSFITLFTDGAVLQTIQGVGMQALPVPDDVTVNFVQTRDPAVTWQSHQAHFQTLAREHEPIVAVNLEQVKQQFYERLLPHLIKNELVEPAGPQAPDTYYNTPREVLRYTWQSIFGQRQRQRIAKEARSKALPAPFNIEAFPIELEVQAHIRSKQKGRRRTSLWGRLGLIVGSLFLFILSFLQLFDTEQLIILLIALVIHEGGHLLALKLRGYQNLSMVFLPFLGAVAAGEKENASLFDKMLVVFMGPVPGLFISLGLVALVFIFSRDWFWQFSPIWLDRLWNASFFFAFLNGFNLLPFFPLDGGQIVRRVLFARAPIWDAIMRVSAALAFMGLGLAASDPIMIFIAVLFGLGSLAFLRQLKMQRRIVRSFVATEVTDHGPIDAAFRAIRQAGYGAKLSFPQKQGLVTQLLEIHQDRNEGLIIRAIYLATYGISIMLTIICVVLAFLIGRL